MNPGLRKELSFFTGAAALVSLLAGKKQVAAGLGLATLGLRFVDLPGAFRYAGKSVIVTGGSRGLGLAFAEHLLREGAKVTIVARDFEELQRAELLLARSASPGSLEAIAADVTDLDDLRDVFEMVKNRFGAIDVLVNNAGAISVGPFESMELADYQAQIDLHLKAIVAATQLVVPHFKRAGGGRIINVSSLGGKMPLPHMSAYSASKFALGGFSRAVASELRAHKIFVTTAFPGLVRTGSPIQAVFKGDHEKEYAWFAMGDLNPLVAQSAESVASEILHAAARGQSEIITSLSARLGTFVFNNFPEITNLFSSLASAQLPQGQSRERKTGAMVSGWLQSQPWAKPWLDYQKDLQRRWNQTESVDADRNLGIQSPR